MKTYREISLESFEFWSGAKANAAMLTSEELNYLDDVLCDLYPDGCDETLINDLMWFEFDFCCECIGLRYDAEEDKVIREEE
jgi:hypothetical protein